MFQGRHREKLNKFASCMIGILVVGICLGGCQLSDGGYPTMKPTNAVVTQSTTASQTQEGASDTVTERETLAETWAPSNTTGESVVSQDPKPAYVRESMNYNTMHFEWESRTGEYTFYIDLPVDMNVYAYYHALPRYLGTTNYMNYIGDTYNEEMVEQIVYAFEQIQTDTGYGESNMVREIIHFVQTEFPYRYDQDDYGVEDYPKYPVETVVERGGDCEDTAFLAASIIRKMGYGVAILIMDNHCAVGVKGDSNVEGVYYEVDGVRYYYVETTNTGYEIGMVPENIDTSSAKVYVLK